MGYRAAYTCPECGFHVKSMASGHDVGMFAHMVGVSCADCRQLYIVELPGHPWEPVAQEAAAAAQAGRVPVGTQCPVAARHVIALWTAPGPCPCCQATMEETGDAILWD